MKIFDGVGSSLKSFRFWSRLFGAMSIAPLAYFMYHNWLFSQWAKEQAGQGGWVCGTGMVLLLAGSAVATAALSGMASLLGFIGYLRTAKPRQGKQLMEVMLVGSILPVAVAIMAGLLAL